MKSLVASFIVVSLCILPGRDVAAHSTGKESRAPAGCQKLPSAERAVCMSCVTRPAKHHYHPEYPAGARCRPDNGKP